MRKERLNSDVMAIVNTEQNYYLIKVVNMIFFPRNHIKNNCAYRPL